MAWIQSLSALYNLIRPILDIAIVAFLLYKTYELLAKTHALQLVKGAVFLLLVYGIAYLFKLSTLQWMLSILWPGIFITIAIVFQPEFRKIIISLGQGGLFKPNSEQRIGQLEIVVTAAELLSRKKRGMLAVFPRKIVIKNIIDTGTKLNADISSNLIVSIFEFDGPLHDGAMVIQHGKIAAAGCLLPLSEQEDKRHNFGTRHRASLGMTEQSDAVVLVVSEETGAISLAYDTRLHYDLSPAEVTRKLTELLDKGSRKEADTETAPEPEGKEDVLIEN
jgi:diadenylate cyclase